jgi:branched-chain amino acid aminotransferase
MEHSISISPKAERLVKGANAPFGVQPTEHMFISQYKDGQWQDNRIVPFADLTMSPFALCLHYGQTVFEGMKAFMMEDGRINVFRPGKHYQRFTASLERMCMPVVPESLFTEAIHQLMLLDGNWIPSEENGSLYIRPFMIASEERLGIKVAEEYMFMVVCSPAFQYYTKPLKVKVEMSYSRAADGGTGYAKCGGNYGGALYPTKLANAEGYDQVIWTDSVHHKYIEESGTMNLMFIIDGTLITPPLSGTILDGVTRDSLLNLAQDLDIKIDVRPISIDELQIALEDGKRVEAFGAGTAAVVAPIELLAIEHRQYACYIGEDAKMYELKNRLTAIRLGAYPDNHNWNFVI